MSATSETTEKEDTDEKRCQADTDVEGQSKQRKENARKRGEKRTGKDKARPASASAFASSELQSVECVMMEDTMIREMGERAVSEDSSVRKMEPRNVIQESCCAGSATPTKHDGGLPMEPAGRAAEETIRWRETDNNAERTERKSSWE